MEKKNNSNKSKTIITLLRRQLTVKPTGTGDDVHTIKKGPVRAHTSLRLAGFEWQCNVISQPWFSRINDSNNHNNNEKCVFWWKPIKKKQCDHGRRDNKLWAEKIAVHGHWPTLLLYGPSADVCDERIVRTRRIVRRKRQKPVWNSVTSAFYTRDCVGRVTLFVVHDGRLKYNENVTHPTVHVIKYYDVINDMSWGQLPLKMIIIF